VLAGFDRADQNQAREDRRAGNGGRVESSYRVRSPFITWRRAALPPRLLRWPGRPGIATLRKQKVSRNLLLKKEQPVPKDLLLKAEMPKVSRSLWQKQTRNSLSPPPQVLAHWARGKGAPVSCSPPGAGAVSAGRCTDPSLALITRNHVPMRIRNPQQNRA
jgi:hypothetical protein